MSNGNDLDHLDHIKIEENKPITDEELKKRMGAQIMKQGEEIHLSQVDYALKKMLVGVGWDVPGSDLTGIDLDFSIFLLDKNDMTREDSDFVFYNNPSTLENAVNHTGDSRTGAGEGDDERVYIDLEALPFDIMKIMFVISIYEPDIRDHSLAMVQNCFLRIVNQETDVELLRYNLEEKFTNKLEAAVLMAELVREGPVWLFRVLCQPVEGGLNKIATQYGLMITG